MTTSPGEKPKPLHILELGAGTGFPNILAARILGDQDSSPVIIATVYHPDVPENLKTNIAVNFPLGREPPVAVRVLD
jgi:predicted nicotinamide N-methyase